MDVQQNIYLKKGRIKAKWLDEFGSFCLAVLPVLGFFVFGLIPMALSVYMSFTDLKLPILGAEIWIGFGNYTELFNNESFFKSFLNTFYYLLTVPFSLALGLLVAHLLNKITFFNSVEFPTTAPSPTIAFPRINAQ